ncbi:hypothetical protein AB0B56_22315 [Streptosporangium canum]|uniref:hypothetical protein n=1 Tax=Streptosporangium canum TaxID=324952 RepID=UPI00341BB37F
MEPGPAEEKQLQPAFRRLDERFGLSRSMRRMPIHSQENLSGHIMQQPFKKLDKPVRAGLGGTIAHFGARRGRPGASGGPKASFIGPGIG